MCNVSERTVGISKSRTHRWDPLGWGGGRGHGENKPSNGLKGFEGLRIVLSNYTPSGHAALGGALVVHLSDLRVCSEVRGTCCCLLYVESDPAPLAPDLARLLHTEAKAERREAFKSGHSHPLAKVPAVPSKRKITTGIPTQLLSQVRAQGVRRRFSSKTPRALALLRLAPRMSVQSPLGAAHGTS